MTSYTFKNKTYTIGDLENLNRQQLADLSNEITGQNLGPAKDKTAAITRALKALKSLGTQARAEEKKPSPPKAPEEKPADPPKTTSKLEGYTPKAARARPIKRLNTHLLSKIKKVRAPAANERLKFWDKYEDGVTLAHVVMTNGLDDTQVRYWVKLGCMKLVPPTDKERDEQMELFAKEGRVA